MLCNRLCCPSHCRRINSFLSQSYATPSKSKQSSFEDFFVSAEQDTFRVDMSRFQCFNTSAPQSNSFLHSDFKSSLDSPAYKVPPTSTPPRLQNPRRSIWTIVVDIGRINPFQTDRTSTSPIGTTKAFP